ncbi:hypothetical protein PR048_011564 [Dryococelus australis]|uniref:Uncharacterized protein n=1 Tax=Dryococelus australis TaxID=614101 RepID=A0ABQ9HM95_9NEOP|nr:hypothetical protein PR048_011564 [Dryococelus australis]
MTSITEQSGTRWDRRSWCTHQYRRKKFLHRWHGPYIIDLQISPNLYKIRTTFRGQDVPDSQNGTAGHGHHKENGRVQKDDLEQVVPVVILTMVMQHVSVLSTPEQ